MHAMPARRDMPHQLWFGARSFSISVTSIPRPKRPRQVLAWAALLLAAAAIYLGMLLRAKFEIGGAQPHPAVTGLVQDIQQRAMEPYCTGVVRTPHDTWLVGRLEDTHDSRPQPEGSVLLDTLVSGGKRLAETDPEDWSNSWGSWSRKRQQTSYVSRLGQDGVFHEIARLNGTGCLIATPGGDTLYLLTDLPRPTQMQPAMQEQASAQEQSVVLRSDDRGRSWQWQEPGWLPQVSAHAWSIRPWFHGTREVWAWQDFRFAAEQPAPGQASGLFYSPDLGRSVESITASAALLQTFGDIRAQPPGDADGANPDGKYGRIQAHVIQSGPDRAELWISQTFMHGPPDMPSPRASTSITTRAELQRNAGRWDMASPEQSKGFAISELQTNTAGKTIAVLQRDGEAMPQIAEWNGTSKAWSVHGQLPSPFLPLPSSSRLRDFQVGAHVLLANTMSSHEVPRWLTFGRRASISADAVYYSSDWGTSWKQLDIDGYLGMLGFEAESGRIHWAQGHWNSSRDRQIHSYTLNPDAP